MFTCQRSNKRGFGGGSDFFRQVGTQSLNLSVRKEMAERLRVEKSVEESEGLPGRAQAHVQWSAEMTREKTGRAWREGGSGSSDSED